MDRRLREVLSGQGGNYILPFLWVDTEHRDDLAGQVEVIYRSGARSLCVESRPHEDFCGETWWQDMDVILAEAKKRDMKVWLLDDKHFPTGYTNGAMERHPELRKRFLRERHIDVMGPMAGCTLLLEDTPDALLGVCACRRSGTGEELAGETVDLTENVQGRWLGWDVPEGCWRVFFLYSSQRGGYLNQNQYIDVLREESVRVLIDTVYEPHFRRYGSAFGETFAGFFSDEPCFGNDLAGQWTVDYGYYDHRLGMPGLFLPWNQNVEQGLRARGVTLTDLPRLWYGGPGEAEIRLSYMDAVTKLYRDCFSRQIGDWCRAHGVLYIGHIVEDMNAHARLGCSAGHFFRALEGQDMSGIDIVLHQVMPGMAHYPHASMGAGGMADPAFFHYVLGKLAASQSHITPGMAGRAMCEVFGAYGWAEGVPAMKWLVDFLLVRGVNHFVPHAFSPYFPNGDCPPHFYAGGNDPQFEGFAALMDYTNRAAHLLSGGVHRADAAVLYHAEGEWMSRRGEAMLTEAPAKALYDDHIDYDILPADTVCRDAAVTPGGAVAVGQETYRCLIVPAAARLPEELLSALRRLESRGADILFVERRPAGAENCGQAVPLAELAKTLRRRGYASVEAEGCPLLRIYHVEREKTHIFMLFNESTAETADTVVKLPVEGPVLRLDLLGGGCSQEELPESGLKVRLSPYASQIIVAGDLPETACSAPARWEDWKALDGLGWEVTLLPSDGSGTVSFTTEKLENITEPGKYPDFSGKMRYRASFTLETLPGKCRLALGNVGQVCRAAVNGTDLGCRICQPYAFELDGVLRPGVNTLEVEAANTLVHRMKDYFSLYMPIPPSGLLGPVTLQRASE